MSAGYVYVLSNRSMPGMVKIGKTARKPATRATELYASGVPTPFIIEATIKTPDMDTTERAVHALLSAQRVNQNREFFRATIPQAVAALRQAVEDGPGRFKGKPKQPVTRKRRALSLSSRVKDVPLPSAVAMTAMLYPSIATFHSYAGFTWIGLCALAATIGTPPILREYLAVLGKGFGLRHGVASAIGVVTFLPVVNDLIAARTFVLSEMIGSYMANTF